MDTAAIIANGLRNIHQATLTPTIGFAQAGESVTRTPTQYGSRATETHQIYKTTCEEKARERKRNNAIKVGKTEICNLYKRKMIFKKTHTLSTQPFCALDGGIKFRRKRKRKEGITNDDAKATYSGGRDQVNNKRERELIMCMCVW